MQNIIKISTYMGFAIKSNQVIFGFDNIEKTRKRISLIVISPTISDKSYKMITEVASKKNIKYLLLDKNLEDIIKRKNCKIIGITNENLSNAIITNSK